MFRSRQLPVATVFLFAALAIARPAHAQLFGPRVDLDTGPVPRDVAVGDIDEDGHLDIAVTVQGADVVSIFPGNGNLTFRPRVEVAVRPAPFALALADWTGDGNLDLLVGAASDTTLTVYVGNGLGGFAPGSSVKCPTIPYDIEIADVTGDGRLDAVIAADESSVALFDVAGTVGGGLGVPRVLVAAAGARSRSIAVAQIDGVAGPDIYFSSTLGPSQVLRSDGAGGFLGALPVAGSGATGGVALGEIDGDGIADAVEVSPGGIPVLRLLRGLPGGGFAPVQSFEVGGNPTSPVIADFNLDGRPDVAFLSGNGTQVSVSLFACALEPPAGAQVDLTASDLAIGDFDEDGDVDYVSANLSGASVSVRRNDGGEASCDAFPEATPQALDFGLAPVDYVQTLPVRIDNVGEQALLLLGATHRAPGFAHDPIPLASIPAGGHATIFVHALRPGLGVFLDTLVVETSSAAIPFLEIPLRAEGRVGLPAAPSVSPTSLLFPLHAQGFPVQLPVSVLNLGETTFNVTGVTFDGGEFHVDDAFPLAVGPAASRTLTVVCTHATLGATSDTLRIQTDDPGTPVLVVPLSASTRLPQPILVVDPASLAFPSAAQGVPSDRAFEARNAGEIDLLLSAPQLGTAEYTVLDTYPQVIPAGATRTLGVRYLRTTLGQALDTLRIATNVPGVPQVAIPLSGSAFEGTPVPTWPSNLWFGEALVGTKTTLGLPIGNSGNAPFTILAASLNSSEFTLVSPLPVDVHPGQQVILTVRYERTLPGPASGAIFLQTTSLLTPAIALSGVGIPATPAGELLSDSLSFGTVAVGAFAEINAHVHSTGVGPLTVTSVAVASPDLTVLTPMPRVIPQGGVAAIRFRFTPSTPGPFLDVAQIHTNMPGDPIFELILTSGVLRPPIVDFEPELIAPVELAVGNFTSVPVSLSNLGDEAPLIGTATVTIDSVTSPPTGAPLVVDAAQMRFDGEGHVWDVQPDGSIATGDPAAFAGGLDWFGFPALATATLRHGGRTIELGPTTSGVRDFTRSVYVPLSGAWIRYVDTVRNRTNAPITYRIIMRSQTAPALAVIARTSSGGPALHPINDDWGVLADEAGPAIGHVFAGPGAQRPATAAFGISPHGVNYDYVLALAPGATASILHFALQAPTLAEAMARAEALRTPDAAALEGLTAVERLRIVNFAVPRPISIPPTSLSIPPLGSQGLAIGFDASAMYGEEVVYGSLRVKTNDPVRPLVVMPLELRILGTPDVIGVGPDGLGLVLAARFLPNPVSGRGVRLAYALPTAGDARFDLYDVRGRRVASRALTGAPAGPGWLDWTGRAADGASGMVLAPGVYWSRLTHGGKSVITKGVVLN